ncbi:MAG: ABC transporter substrate-binding protein [Coriobacteriia bacterium]|nr:ABC transporter substrate-binding protein [Coriobacteriia bacterium]
MATTKRTGGRILGTIILVLVAALSIAGCATPAGDTSGGGAAPPKEPVKIGAVLSLTGSYAGLGAPEKNTLLMEVAAINAAGGVNGRQIELFIEDDATDPAKAQAAAVKLIEQYGVVALIGATGTGQTMGMRGDVDRAGVPQVSVAGGTVITAQFDPLVFQTPWSNSLVVPFTLERLKKDGVAKIALIADSGGFGKDGIDVIKKLAPDYGITVSSEQLFNAGDTDMTSQLTKIKGSGAQAVVMWTAGKEAAIVASNMKQLGMTVPLVGSHGNARREFITGAGPAAEGFTFAAGKVLSPDQYGTGSPEYKVATDFIDRYTKQYGSAPDTFAGHAYDAIHIIANALGTVDEVTPSKLRDAIEQTKGFVGVGGTFTFSPTDHNGMKATDLVTYEVTGGEWTVLK